MCSFDHPAIYHDLHLCLATANDLSLLLEATRIGWNDILMRLGYQFNSYNLIEGSEKAT
jgi:hypothetical protein